MGCVERCGAWSERPTFALTEAQVTYKEVTVLGFSATLVMSTHGIQNQELCGVTSALLSAVRTMLLC